MAVAAVNVEKTNFFADLPGFEGWNDKKRILIILAHPDDPEFFMGATVAHWGLSGHDIRICLLTTGQKGSQDYNQKPAKLAALRKTEQKAAADFLGVNGLEFLDYIDGELIPDREMRKQIVRVIRRHSPQILVTSDPLNYFPGENRVNHPDHRAVGQVVLDAAFPAAGNPMFFPELLQEEGLIPVNLEELWFSIPAQANLEVDVTNYFEKKIQAICRHRSQIGENIDNFKSMLRSRWGVPQPDGSLRFFERFRRIQIK